ncbi:MAG: hypothetical protein A3D16_12050 [Rhodobacterales bacterium RIFCSPHIGHO2_02_FULL_62_130]|jgi:hypothetical protein|nr:MAG: hypothetical protein A3D16_12050 [Rhodobacterales bacterium RIFCSPHIGHO2_02_FULL_62_130]OHC53835.1 MAG: hypothetical protein A3E48_23070 [Rhodobacterales bacterium RIFCSPHIGHO2_12_FULL_62_75]HCZ00197.1 hypothetical protein [Rhodobacter sp.]
METQQGVTQMTTYTYTAAGNIETAENDRFKWFFLADSYVMDKVEGRSLYLPTAGYSKATGFGSDPAEASVVAAARAFVVDIYAENQRLEKARIDSETYDESISDWLTRDMDRADSNN